MVRRIVQRVGQCASRVETASSPGGGFGLPEVTARGALLIGVLIVGLLVYRLISVKLIAKPG